MVPRVGLQPARPQRSDVLRPWQITLLAFRYIMRNTNSCYLAILGASGCVRRSSVCHLCHSNTPLWGWELTADEIVMVFAQTHLECEAAPENGGDFGTDR